MHTAPPQNARTVARWLMVIVALIIGIVIVGGITRLTESGLSITQWKPITGFIPPLTQAQWEAAFADYQKIPQYQAIHADMTLASFKKIYFWEYFHRLIARIIGFAFVLPALWFWAKGKIPKGYGRPLIVMLILGGLQGVVGWWMVKSGLSERTEVSQFRLAIHLLLALLVMGVALWTALDLFDQAKGRTERRARLTGLGALGLGALTVQLAFGALTAGLRAGAVANSWPLMQGHFFPQGVEWLSPWWETFGYDPYLVHFVHRWWAWVALAALLPLARQAKQAGDRPASIALHSTIGLQILIGIATVEANVALPLAALHQAVGALVTAAAIWCAHSAGRRLGAGTP